jgi:hypothetical protein
VDYSTTLFDLCFAAVKHIAAISHLQDQIMCARSSTLHPGIQTSYALVLIIAMDSSREPVASGRCLQPAGSGLGNFLVLFSHPGTYHNRRVYSVENCCTREGQTGLCVGRVFGKTLDCSEANAQERKVRPALKFNMRELLPTCDRAFS